MEIAKIARRGIKWTTMSAISLAVIQLLRLSVLTRFLEKTDFGVVAILTFVLGIFQLFSNLGFASAIMYKKEIDSEEFSSLYWIQLLTFVFMYLLSLLAIKPISVFYNTPDLVVLLPISLSGLLILGTGVLYDTLFNKLMAFKTLAIRNIVASICSFILAVVLAVNNAGIYSLIFSSLFYSAIVNLWNLIAGRRIIPLQMKINFYKVKPLVKIGLYQTATQLIDYVTRRLDILLIGKFLGTEALGIYNLAKELVLKLVSLINSISTKVALPLLSYLQDDDEILCDNYCTMIKMLSFVNFPILLFIGVLSSDIVFYLYGEDFGDVAFIIKVLSIWGMFVCVGNPVGTIVTSKGRTDLSFIFVVVRFLVVFPIIFVAAKANLTMVSGAILFCELISCVLSWYLQLKLTIGLKFRRHLSSFLDILINSILSGLLVYSISVINICKISNHVLSLIVYGICLIFVYSINMFLFNKETVGFAMHVIANNYYKIR